MRKRNIPGAPVRTDLLLVGVDTGGTFTDIVYRLGNRAGVLKTASTPSDPAVAVLAALAQLFPDKRATRITYGTTVATNAMLERRGAITALLTTRGFEDVLEIGRQARPDLYALEPEKVEPLVPPRLRIGVRERTRHDGGVALRLSATETRGIRRRMERLGVEAIAVVLLHSHVNPSHERQIARALRGLRVPVTLSSDLSPLPGEYERTSTTVANAYVRTSVERHLRSLQRRARADTLQVMQSNGGAIGIAVACAEPVRTMLSGPAGGVAAAANCAARAGFERVITLDMGGTSTDVALVDSTPQRRATTDIGGVPIRTPCLDIHTVGAGGGSIACIDAGGALRVGPQSAGARPGPACYGEGTEPTVTDANVVLGRLRPEAFLGGGMTLDSKRAHQALSRLARRMRSRSVTAAADGVIRVVQNNMERAIRVITVERGQDPRTCVLVPFGGAAGLHACGLAEELGISRILIPPDPGLLSAWGMLNAPLVRDLTRSLRIVDPTFADLRPISARLARMATSSLAGAGAPATAIRTRTFVRLRYLGEGSTLEIPLERSFLREFAREHSRLFHSEERDGQIECTSIRATASAASAWPKPARSVGRADDSAASGRRVAISLDGKLHNVPIVARVDLRRARMKGPCLITEYSSTSLLAPGWTLRGDTAGNLHLES